MRDPPPPVCIYAFRVGSPLKVQTLRLFQKASFWLVVIWRLGPSRFKLEDF
jgi:hypothetical protein